MGEVLEDRGMDREVIFASPGAFAVGGRGVIAPDGKTIVEFDLQEISLVDPGKLLIDPKKIGIIRNIGLPKTPWWRRKIDPIWGRIAYAILEIMLLGLAVVVSILLGSPGIGVIVGFWTGVFTQSRIKKRMSSLLDEDSGPTKPIHYGGGRS